MVGGAEVRGQRFALELEEAVMPLLSLRAVINVPFVFSSPVSEVWPKSVRSLNQAIVSGTVK